MTLSDKIIKLRREKGISQEELAEKLNVSRQAISRWEMGTAMPDAANILRISKLLGITTDYLLNDDYESDDDLPKIRETKEDNNKQILIYLVTIEVMTLLLQFMTVFILQNILFAFLSFVPFIALIGSFEYVCRKKASSSNQAVALFRRKFHKISAWLGLYFPIRIALTMVATLYPRPYHTLAFECVALAVYFTAATLVDLQIDKNYIQKHK